jgi:hypothetical protein
VTYYHVVLKDPVNEFQKNAFFLKSPCPLLPRGEEIETAPLLKGRVYRVFPFFTFLNPFLRDTGSMSRRLPQGKEEMGITVSGRGFL